ncbi:MAG TPA: hypothetical protein VHA75_13130, partial [Rugosimonospora sp.]|nr:hypothetical protein [Rugosimonospora sp.]
MRDLSKAWRDLADQMNHALTAGDTAAMQIITAWGGDAGNAFSEYWDAIAVGPDSGLPAVMDNAQNLADLVDDAAMQIEYAKLVLVITLVITVITLIVCQILAFFTGGASEAAAAAEVAAAREVATTIFQQLMRWILRVLVKKVLVKFVLHEVQMVVAQVGADYLAQKIQFEEGTRTQWNPDWFKTDLVSALITGAVTFPMSLVHLPVKSTAGKYAANAAFHGVTNGLVMPASMVLTNHALTGEWNTDDITWKTFVYSGINGAGMSLAGTGLHDLTTGKDGANPTRVLTDPTALSGDHPTTTVDDVTLAGAQTTLGDPHVLGTSPRDVPTGTDGGHDTTVVVPSGGSHTDPVTLAGGPHTDVAPHPDVTAPVDTPAPPAGDPPAGAPPAGPPAEPNGPAASGPAGDHPSIIPPGDNPSGGSVTLPSDTARPDQAAVVQPSTAQPHDTGTPMGTPPADAPRGAVVVPVGPDTTVRPEVSAPVHGQDGGPTVVSRPDAGGPPSGGDRAAQGGPGGDGPAAVILPDGPRPDVTARPDLTARPDAGARPDLTARPDGGGRPDATSRPDATARPDSTARPDPAARPDATTRADGTRGVDDTARGGADGGSGTTVRPDGTDGAARPDGGGPDAGTRPDGAGGHDGAAHPDRDGGVGTHPESGEPAQPHDTGNPTGT